jgi:hypothetical protein
MVNESQFPDWAPRAYFWDNKVHLSAPAGASREMVGTTLEGARGKASVNCQPVFQSNLALHPNANSSNGTVASPFVYKLPNAPGYALFAHIHNEFTFTNAGIGNQYKAPVGIDCACERLPPDAGGCTNCWYNSITHRQWTNGSFTAGQNQVIAAEPSPGVYPGAVVGVHGPSNIIRGRGSRSNYYYSYVRWHEASCPIRTLTPLVADSWETIVAVNGAQKTWQKASGTFPGCFGMPTVDVPGLTVPIVWMETVRWFEQPGSADGGFYVGVGACGKNGTDMCVTTSRDLESWTHPKVPFGLFPSGAPSDHPVRLAYPSLLEDTGGTYGDDSSNFNVVTSNGASYLYAVRWNGPSAEYGPLDRDLVRFRVKLHPEAMTDPRNFP